MYSLENSHLIQFLMKTIGEIPRPLAERLLRHKQGVIRPIVTYGAGAGVLPRANNIVFYRFFQTSAARAFVRA